MNAMVQASKNARRQFMGQLKDFRLEIDLKPYTQQLRELRALEDQILNLEKQQNQAVSEGRAEIKITSQTQAEYKRGIEEVNKKIEERKNAENANTEEAQEQIKTLESEKERLQQILQTWKDIQSTAQGVSTAGSSKAQEDLDRAQQYQDARRGSEENDADIDNENSNIDNIVKNADKINTVQQNISLLTNTFSLLSSAIGMARTAISIWSNDSNTILNCEIQKDNIIIITKLKNII